MIWSPGSTNSRSMQFARNRRVQPNRIGMRDVERHRVHAAIQRDATARALVAREREDRDVGADARHPQRRRTRLGQARRSPDVHVVGRVHDGVRDRLRERRRTRLEALGAAVVRELVFLGALDHLGHRLDGLAPGTCRPQSPPRASPRRSRPSPRWRRRDTSARVGTGLWIIDSIICVAVMTDAVAVAGDLLDDVFCRPVSSA